MDPVIGPVNIAPAQPKMFRRTTHPDKPTQSKDQPPLSVGAGVEYTGDFLTGHKVESLRVRLHIASEI